MIPFNPIQIVFAAIVEGIKKVAHDIKEWCIDMFTAISWGIVEYLNRARSWIFVVLGTILGLGIMALIACLWG